MSGDPFQPRNQRVRLQDGLAEVVGRSLSNVEETYPCFDGFQEVYNEDVDGWPVTTEEDYGPGSDYFLPSATIEMLGLCPLTDNEFLWYGRTTPTSSRVFYGHMVVAGDKSITRGPPQYFDLPQDSTDGYTGRYILDVDTGGRFLFSASYNNPLGIVGYARDLDGSAPLAVECDALLLYEWNGSTVAFVAANYVPMQDEFVTAFEGSTIYNVNYDGSTSSLAFPFEGYSIDCVLQGACFCNGRILVGLGLSADAVGHNSEFLSTGDYTLGFSTAYLVDVDPSTLDFSLGLDIGTTYLRANGMVPTDIPVTTSLPYGVYLSGNTAACVTLCRIGWSAVLLQMGQYGEFASNNLYAYAIVSGVEVPELTQGFIPGTSSSIWNTPGFKFYGDATSSDPTTLTSPSLGVGEFTPQVEALTSGSLPCRFGQMNISGGVSLVVLGVESGSPFVKTLETVIESGYSSVTQNDLSYSTLTPGGGAHALIEQSGETYVFRSLVSFFSDVSPVLYDDFPEGTVLSPNWAYPGDPSAGAYLACAVTSTYTAEEGVTLINNVASSNADFRFSGDLITPPFVHSPLTPSNLGLFTAARLLSGDVVHAYQVSFDEGSSESIQTVYNSFAFLGWKHQLLSFMGRGQF